MSSATPVIEHPSINPEATRPAFLAPTPWRRLHAVGITLGLGLVLAACGGGDGGSDGGGSDSGGNASTSTTLPPPSASNTVTPTPP